MKKLLTILLAAVLCLSCLAMVGCGVEGEYSFYAIEYNGETYKVGDEVAGLGKLEAEDFESFELAKDGVYKVAGKEVPGVKWEEKDGKVILKAGDIEVSSMTIDGKTLYTEMAGMKIIFKR